MNDVVKNINRPSKELLEAYKEMSSASLHEVMGKKGAMSSDMRPVWPGTKVVGSALTVQSRPGDNLMLHKAITLAQPGDILVVTVDGCLEGGLWGEIVTVAAMYKGMVGIVTDGSVRDTVQIRDLGFALFSRGVSMKGTTKLTPGKINNPINMCGVTINPGDIVLGDNDGVVVVPLEKAEEVLKAATARDAYEQTVMDRIRKGEGTMDILGFNDAYNRLGLKEE